jgi:hypothetical protein
MSEADVLEKFFRVVLLQLHDEQNQLTKKHSASLRAGLPRCVLRLSAADTVDKSQRECRQALE